MFSLEESINIILPLNTFLKKGMCYGWLKTTFGCEVPVMEYEGVCITYLLLSGQLLGFYLCVECVDLIYYLYKIRILNTI